MVNRTHSGGVTGDIEINVAGDRINAAYDVYNMKEMQSGQKYLKKVGHFDQDEKMVVNDSYIVWPGNETQVPRGVFISTHLKVGKTAILLALYLFNPICDINPRKGM